MVIHLNMLCSLVLLGLVSISFVTAVSIKCDKNSKLPEDLDEQYADYLGDQNGMHPSFQLLPGIYRQMGRKDVNAPSTKTDGKISYIAGDRNCTKEMSNRSGNINDRSTCPWYFLLSYDGNRYPSTMATARCRCNRSCYMPKDHRNTCRRRSQKCRHCRDENCRKKCTRKCEENILLPQCVEIPYRYKVLKQKYDINGDKICDNKGHFVYVRTYETVAIGCTCAVPKKDTKASNKKYATEY